MPTRPLAPCASPRCAARAQPGARWCAAHGPVAREQSAAQRTAHDARRGSAHARGYDARWQKARAHFLAEKRWRCAGYFPGVPLSALSSQLSTSSPCPIPARVVDHITPHRGDPGLFWDQSNWQPLCLRCHNRKTATEDGGFRGAASAPLAPPASRLAPSAFLGLV